MRSHVDLSSQSDFVCTVFHRQIRQNLLLQWKVWTVFTYTSLSLWNKKGVLLSYLQNKYTTTWMAEMRKMISDKSMKKYTDREQDKWGITQIKRKSVQIRKRPKQAEKDKEVSPDRKANCLLRSGVMSAAQRGLLSSCMISSGEKKNK